MNDKKVAEAVKGFAAAKVERALQLIAAGGITELDFAPNTFDVLSSDGHTHYMTTADACQCIDARRDNKCKHQAAARLLIAARGCPECRQHTRTPAHPNWQDWLDDPPGTDSTTLREV